LTHPPDIILIFDIVIAHNGDEPLKEELNDLYSSHNIVRVTKLIRMRWLGYVAVLGGGEAEVYTGFWLRNIGERDNLEDPDVDGRIILK